MRSGEQRARSYTWRVDPVSHRFGVGVNPMEDTRKKIGAIAPVRPNAKILDVCTGLAYTACAASALGARVTTIELDPAMTEMCRANPRSRALFTGEIRQLYGDAAEVVAVGEQRLRHGLELAELLQALQHPLLRAERRPGEM